MPWVGVRSAKEYGPISPQNPTALQGLMGTTASEQGEECLSLNIWTPACDTAKRPVMVWVHGGAFVTGAGSLGLYNGKALAASGDVVVVTINYRLGGLGFLRLADVTAGTIPSIGNEGLLDQIVALEWVRDNIASFGGDASNVTIFGESAGAMSIVALLACPSARGLFHKAISQSGGGHIGHSKDHANRIADVFLNHLGVGVHDLERTSVESLLKAQLALISEIDTQHDPHKLGTLAFQPTVDGAVLPERPIDAIRKGCAKGVPLIAGTTSEEWKLWTALDAKAQSIDESRLQNWATKMFAEHASSVLAAGQELSPYDRYVAMQTNRAFREPTRRLLSAQSVYAPVYEYVFDWRSPAMGGAFGACHAIELGFVFGSYSMKGPDNFFGTGPGARELHQSMMDTWTSFARSGVPAGSWPQWGSASNRGVVFGKQAQAVQVLNFDAPPAWAKLPDRLIGS